MNQKGIAPIAIILIIIGVLALAGGAWYYSEVKKNNDIANQNWDFGLLGKNQRETPSPSPTPQPSSITVQQPKGQDKIFFIFPKGGEILEIWPQNPKVYDISWTPFALEKDEWIRLEIENVTEGGIVNLMEKEEIYSTDIKDFDLIKGTAKWTINYIIWNILHSKTGNSNQYQLIISKIKKRDGSCDPTGCPEDVQIMAKSNPFFLNGPLY